MYIEISRTRRFMCKSLAVVAEEEEEEATVVMGIVGVQGVQGRAVQMATK